MPASKTTQAESPATVPPVYPYSSLKSSIVFHLSNRDVLKRIHDAKAERGDIEPQKAREELRKIAEENLVARAAKAKEGETVGVSPSERRMTLEMVKKHASSKVAKKWEALDSEIHELTSQCARGNNDIGAILSNLMEWTIGEILVNATRNVHADKLHMLKPKHVVDHSDDDVPSFIPLVNTLSSWVAIESMVNPEDGEGEAEGSDEEDVSSDVSDEESLEPQIRCAMAPQKINKRIHKVTTYKTSIPKPIQECLNGLVVDLIVRLADISRVLLRFKGQRTVSESTIVAALQIIYADNGLTEAGDALIKRICKVRVNEDGENEGGEGLGLNLDDVPVLESPEPKPKAKKAAEPEAEEPKKARGKAAKKPVEEAAPTKAKSKGKGKGKGKK